MENLNLRKYTQKFVTQSHLFRPWSHTLFYSKIHMDLKIRNIYINFLIAGKVVK